VSSMSELARQIEEAGIDYRVVDLEDVEALMLSYQEKTGHTMTMIQAARELYL
jgi:hypothetical protein